MVETLTDQRVGRIGEWGGGGGGRLEGSMDWQFAVGLAMES